LAVWSVSRPAKFIVKLVVKYNLDYGYLIAGEKMVRECLYCHSCINEKCIVTFTILRILWNEKRAAGGGNSPVESTVYRTQQVRES